MHAASPKERRVALVGIGATGAGIARAVLSRPGWSLARVVDPEKAGENAAAVAGVAGPGASIESSTDDLARDRVEVAIVATVSRAAQVVETIAEILEQGVPVVTICEELTHPAGEPAIVEQLDQLARAKGVALVGTGVNPGFLMDTLPLCLTAVMDRVQRIQVTRVVDFSEYGGAVARFGLGLTEEEFLSARADGQLPGFLGFLQSMGQVCEVLGWSGAEMNVEPLEPLVIAATPRPGLLIDVAAGTVAEVGQRATTTVDGREVIELELKFGYLKSEGIDGGDEIAIVGCNRTLRLATEPPGFDSLGATAAIATNLAAHAPDLPSGFCTTADLPVSRLAAPGALGQASSD